MTVLIAQLAKIHKGNTKLSRMEFGAGMLVVAWLKTFLTEKEHSLVIGYINMMMILASSNLEPDLSRTA